MNTKEYKIKEPVIGPLMKSGSFFKSKTAATGIPKLDTGPQKWVVNKYLNVCLLKMFLNDIAMSKSFGASVVRFPERSGEVLEDHLYTGHTTVQRKRQTIVWKWYNRNWVIVQTVRW